MGVKKYNSDVITKMWGQIILKGQKKIQLFAIENEAFVVTILTLLSKSTSECRIFKKSAGINLIYKFSFIQWDVIYKDQKFEFRIMYIQTNCLIFAFFFWQENYYIGL